MATEGGFSLCFVWFFCGFYGFFVFMRIFGLGFLCFFVLWVFCVLLASFECFSAFIFFAGSFSGFLSRVFAVFLGCVFFSGFSIFTLGSGCLACSANFWKSWATLSLTERPSRDYLCFLNQVSQENQV